MDDSVTVDSTEVDSNVADVDSNVADVPGNQMHSLDIEQSVPTVGELTGKSENDDDVRRKRVGSGVLCAVVFCTLVVVSVIVAVSVGGSSRSTGSAAMDAGQQLESSGANRRSAVFDFLENNLVSSRAAIDTAGTPQNTAAIWMADNDARKLDVPVTLESTSGYKFVQRYVMVVFFYTLRGWEWNYRLNFLDGSRDVCDWFSIARYASGGLPFKIGVVCDPSGLIADLVFKTNNLKGSLPTELGLLTSVRDIQMEVNQISSSLPNELSRLSNLMRIQLAFNDLTGTLPSFLGKYPKMVSLYFSGNQLDGSLPRELAEMENLVGLALDHNALSGDLNLFSSTSAAQEKMQYLFLEGNLFNGNLSPQIFRHFPNMELMDISDNNFNGELPYNLFTIPSMMVLDLHDNNFSGELPGRETGEIPDNNNLQFLALHKNNLEGEVPANIQKFQKLFHLDLADNSFLGTIPEFLGSMQELEYLFLSKNMFSKGPIPEFLTSLTKLEELSLKSTQRTGMIPTFLGDFSGMLLLDLDNNMLTGQIPTELGQLEKLQFLLLNRNQLTDALPQEIVDLEYMRIMFLDGNNITANLNPFCDRIGLKPIMAANCAGDSPDVVCRCCKVCCRSDEDCNDDNVVPSNDPVWQFGYSRLSFYFGNETGSLAVMRTPP